MNRIILCILLAIVAVNAVAEKAEPSVVTVYKSQANGNSRSYVVGLVNMDEVMGHGCSPMVGTIKIDGIQFTDSGAVLQQIRFRDNKDNVFSVPTNIGSLPKSERGKANNFRKEGKSYFAHMQFCGSGGFGSLINIYDANAVFVAFE